MMKKIALIFVIGFLSMFYLTPAQANARFADVPTSHGAYEEIGYLVDLGVIKGYTEGGKTIFKPNNSVTRGQAAKMVVVATKQQPLIVGKSSFSDVTLGTELSGYVERAVALGYFKEYSVGKFGPNVPLTRDEMSRVLANAFGLTITQYENLAVPFTDVSKSSSYYPYIAAIYYNGITKGDATGTKYNAKEAVKRSQFASFVARASSNDFRLALPIQGVSVPNDADTIANVVVTTDNLNVRSSANSKVTDNILGKVNKGTTFKVYEIGTDGWLKVSYNDVYAYIYQTYTNYLDEAGNPMSKVAKQLEANQNTIVYSSRNINDETIASLTKAEKVSIYTTVGNWYSVIVDGVPGYVRISHMSEIKVEEPVVAPKPIEPILPVEEEATLPEPITPPTGDVSTEPIPEPIIPIEVPLTTVTIGKATVNDLNIRQSDSDSSPSIGKVNRGTYVEVHSIKGNWAKVKYGDISGYIYKPYLQLINQTGSAIAGRIIVLDPGHGGKDGGANRNGTSEKNVVFDIANRVKTKLEASGAIVKMTRVGDTYPS